MWEIPESGRLINLYQGLIRKNACLILQYHRVVDVKDDLLSHTVCVKKFEDQVGYLKRNFSIIALQDLIKHLHEGVVPDNSVVLTFDDGYQDNLYYAKPILEKYEVPATFFITAGMIDNEKEFWWDKLERIFLSQHRKNNVVELNIDNKPYQWNIKSKSEAAKVFHEIYFLLRSINSIERTHILNCLLEWANLGEQGPENNRVVTVNELKRLADGGLIEIGAHSLTHNSLAYQPFEEQRREISQSKKILEDILNISIKSFAYPFGSNTDVTDITRNIVKDAGFNCGIANEQSHVTQNCDLFWLPRRKVENWDINCFHERIKCFLRQKKDPYRKIPAFLEAKRIFKNQLLPVNKRFPIQYEQSKRQAKDILSILQINTCDFAGGAAKIAFAIHQGLLDKKYYSKMLVKDMFSNDAGVDVLFNDYPKRDRVLKYQQKKSWNDLFYINSLGIKNQPIFKQCDLVHLHNLHGDYFSPFALPELSAMKPTVWTLHDMQAITGHCAHSLDCDKWISGCEKCVDLKLYPELSKDSAHFLWDTKKSIYENSYLTIVCPSEWLKKKVEKSILKNQDIRLIYNGIDESIFLNFDKGMARKRLNLPLEKKILMFSAHGGKDNPWKGGAYLDMAFRILQNIENVLFLNVGVTGEVQNRENWVDVPYLTSEEEIALYYAASDVFIYPSLADTCPLVVLESLACGTPVVAFETGGIPELVEHLSNGYIARYKDVEDLVCGIKLLMTETEFYKKAILNARLSVEKRFTQKEMVDKYVQIYYDILDK